ncbi:MAG: hypothetical protein ACXACG_10920 [Candidatus Thorarchaeota archaeon]|jgi:hypothetical protein
MQEKGQRRPIWSPESITVFLTVWALVTPIKVYLYPGIPILNYFYAGLWSYLPGNPFSDSPFIVDPLVSLFFLPFYAPGLAIAWFVLHSSKNESSTRGRYFERIILLILVQAILALLIPCPVGEPVWCIPTPTTGLVALLFASRIVKDIDTPWSEDP